MGTGKITMAITKTADKNEISNSQIFYKSLFDNMTDGLAYCQMVFDAQGKPTDWIYVKVNKNFEKFTRFGKHCNSSRT